jgi:toxin CcdB
MPGKHGYLLALQSDYIRPTETVVVAPLLPISKAPKQVARLNPIFRITDADFMLAIHLVFSIPASSLHYKAGSLDYAHTEIIRAIDMLFSGI